MGENGTGKEHVAEKIHAMSKRSGKPFVAVDCGLLSKELAASALFGHEKGAFTGAENKRKGYWEEADGGTLFLDEIGNLPLEVQQMMLRALESKRYRPIGSSKEKARMCVLSPPPTRTCRPPSPKSVSVRTCYIGLRNIR